jgi:predicted outer membrane repeat protein
MADKMKTIIKNILIALFICSPAFSITIYIPTDYAHIQTGINASLDGDTIIVEPGIYLENINFNSKKIVLGSLFLSTDDTSYISETIIDGDSAGSVIIFADQEDSNTIITGFTIRNGYTISRGGGISCIGAVNPVISHNKIIDNAAESAGGGISCFGSRPEICFNVITDNTANTSGGGIYSRDSSPFIHDNLIASNNAANNGGGIECVDATPIIEYNTISDNTAGLSGGGIDCYNSSNAIISNNIITGNSVGITGNGGGISCILQSNPQISFNVICENNGGQRGGGIYCTASSPSINGNTIYKNAAAWYGGGLYCTESSPAVSNTIFWNNTASSGQQIYVFIGGPPMVSYCDIQDGYPGEGNIDCNPWFCYPDTGNFYLVEGSCCLGAGIDSVDIGAFGSGCGGYPYLPGDANMYMGIWPPRVIGSDVTYLAKYFVDQVDPGIPCLILDFWAAADINGDCRVIGSDVTRLINYFRAIGTISYCPDFPPLWHTADELPDEAPEGWPGCEE